MSEAAVVDSDSAAAAAEEAARTWIAQDPNPVTAAYVQQLLEDAISMIHSSTNSRNTADDNNYNTARARLHTMFPANDKRIAFGTAGLRAAMQPGPLYMNDLVVVQAAQGIARYCQQEFLSNNGHLDDTTAKTKTKKQQLAVVIGYDHRAASAFQLSSLQFAILTTLVFQHAGCFDDVFLLDGYVATPLVPFAVLQLQQKQQQQTQGTGSTTTTTTTTTTCIGIMVTASHNPKQDAGYKVYWTDGCQIRSPTDHGIAACIAQNLEPWMDYGKAVADCQRHCNGSNSNTGSSDPCLGLSQVERTRSIVAAYYNALRSSGLVTGQVEQYNTDSSCNDSTRFVLLQPPPSFCYTAMHGVGHKFAKQAFTAFGLPPFHSVAVQQEPDPDFPTVPFPNPEEHGALDLAKLACETEKNCGDIVLANDPDADRLAVAEKDRGTGEWTVFTGDQIGAMLGHWLWQQQEAQQSKQAGNTRSSANTVTAMCASTVSSKLLAEIARVEGFHFEETLTGFKWIGSRAAQLHGTPVKGDPTKRYHTVFCYEEAIGFCCGNVIFDKDGISALAVFAELSYSVYKRGLNLRQHMQGLYNTYGEFVSNNGYFFLPDNSSVVVQAIMDRITNHGAFDALDKVGPYAIESVRYLGEPGYDSAQPDKKPTLPCSKSSPMITLRFENGCVAQFRGSGTEPKFKYYIELKGRPGVPRDVVAKDLEEMSAFILETLLEPEKNGLRRSKL